MAKEKTKEQLEKEAQAAAKREEREKDLLGLLSALRDEGEDKRVLFLKPITTKIAASKIEEAVKSEVIGQEFADWIIKVSADDEHPVDLIRRTKTYTREKVVHVTPPKFDPIIYGTDDKGKPNYEEIIDEEMYEHAKVFNENLKVFLEENEDHLKIFENREEGLRIYWRTLKEEEVTNANDKEATEAAEKAEESGETVVSEEIADPEDGDVV